MLIVIAEEPDLSEATDVALQVSLGGGLEAGGKSDVDKKIESGDTRQLTSVFSSPLDFQVIRV